MLCMATTPGAKQIALDVLHREIGLQSSGDFEALLWVSPENEIEWVVGYTGFIGYTCQASMVNVGGKYCPKELLFAAFDYPFNYRGRQKVLGIVNSLNTKALEFDKRIGFKEVFRFDAMHDDGGDLIIMEMNKDECRWIKGRKK